MLPVWKTSFLKQVMLAKGGAATGRHGDLCCWIHPLAQTHTPWEWNASKNNRCPLSWPTSHSGPSKPAELAVPPTAALTRHVDQLVHTVLLLRVAQVLVGHNLHVLFERPTQQASQEAGTKRTQDTRVQDFRWAPDGARGSPTTAHYSWALCPQGQDTGFSVS